MHVNIDICRNQFILQFLGVISIKLRAGLCHQICVILRIPCDDPWE
jgi:hypothetical protein